MENSTTPGILSNSGSNRSGDSTPVNAMSNQSGVSSVPQSVGSNLPIISLQSQSISTKLDDGNYLIWKQQVMATIEGFALKKFLYGGTPIPDKFVPGTSLDEVVLNSEYIHWRRQDQLITSWLLSSMTESVLVGAVGLVSSKEIWETLESNYASQSGAKLMQLKFQLQTLKKGSSSMKE